MSKLYEYRDAQALIEQLKQIQAAVKDESADRLELRVSGYFVKDDEPGLYTPIGHPAEKALADAAQHHLPAIVETARGLAGANLMEARAQAALEAAATLTELQPIEDLAEGA